MIMLKNILCALSVFFFASSFFVNAAESLPSFKPVLAQHVEATLLSELKSVAPGDEFWVGLRLRMEDHWHTYWKNSGDSGAPTRIRWKLPAGFTASPIQWPVPERIETPPLVNYGYSNQVVLLTKVRAPSTISEKQIHLEAKASWLVCREECIPGDATLAVSLAVGKREASLAAPVLAIVAQKLPQEVLPKSGWSFQLHEKDGNLEIEGKAPRNVTFDKNRILFFPESDPLIEHAAEQTVALEKHGFTLTLKKSAQWTMAPASVAGTIAGLPSEKGAEQAFQIRVPVSASQPLFVMLLFALMGGVILNLMPCVFPVLSLKIVSFAQLSGHQKGHVRQHGFAFTAGVLVSFWFLAAVLLILRAGGEQLGWGFQLQAPGFLVFLSAVLFIFSLNLLGVFEMGLFLMGVGSNISARSDLLGSFFTGVLATVVATPCTAPFMGVSLGFALTQPAFVALLVFTALGLGMATPYLVLSMQPALLRFLPKPGRWMESLKKAMAFPLLATVLWLSWVYATQTGSEALIYLFAGLLILSFAMWCFGHWSVQARSRVGRAVLLSLVVGMSAVGLAVAFSGVSQKPEAMTAKDANDAWGQEWVEYSPERLEDLRNEGKTIFLDFTAAWCVSCKVNERLVFSSQEVRKKFKQLGIVLMRADWTNRNPAITKMLASFGRSGVPLYVFFPKGAQSTPKVLPEVINSTLVLNELDALLQKGDTQ